MTRAWVPSEKVNTRKVIRVPQCPCGTSLEGVPATTGTWSWQVVEVLEMPICAATVQACCEAVSTALEPATAAVDPALPASNVIHLDETSWKPREEFCWLWLAVGDAITSFAICARRGADQLATWFPDGFAGAVTCDRWRPYERFAQRQLCWSHLERDLQAIIDAQRAGFEPATRAATMFETRHLKKIIHNSFILK